jgi:hypothetical protein
MANIFDYFLWRGDLTFDHSPFNPVDNIILSQLSYLPLDGIVPGPDANAKISVEQTAALFAQKLADNTLAYPLIFKEDPAFMDALGRSDRFRNCELHRYVSYMDIVEEKQFSALCVSLEGCTFIAYRGTDASLVGWKEDFNMSFSTVIPAQLEAVSYLEKAAENLSGPLLTGGHSKGGNLSIYAASSCAQEIQDRITAVYSNDAPGFHRSFIESGGFLKIRQRIHSFVPQSSVIGMLFERGNDYAVVKSTQTGIFQHDLYSWQITHNNMIRLDSIDQGSRFIDKTLREWLGNLDNEHRREFSDALYGILNHAEIKSFSELGADWLNPAIRMIQSLGNIDSTTRKNIGKILGALFEAARNNIGTLLPVPEKKPPAQIGL